MEHISPVFRSRSLEDFSRLVHQIYEAVTRPQAWNEVVAAIGASMGASKGVLFTPFAKPQEGGLIFMWNISEQELQLWATRYIEHDIWSIRAHEGGLWQDGATYVSQDLVSDDELRASVFYREFLSQHGIESICTGVVFGNAPGMPRTSISFFRDRQAPAFDRDDKAWLALLVAHLSRALGLVHRCKALELRAASLHAALEVLPFGVGLLDSRRRVLHMNAAGRAVLAQDDGLVLGEDRMLDAPSHPDGQRLRQWLADRAQAVPERASHFSEGFLVARRGAERQYFVQYAVLPASDPWAVKGESVRYVVFITDPAATRLPPAERLCALYRLTPAESRITLELAQGKSQKEVARQLRIAPSTVHTHAQRVFAKMRLRRHADLVRAVLALGEVAV